MSPGEQVSANLPTNVPWGTKFQRTYLPMSPGELSFSEPTYQCPLGNQVSANLPTNVPWGTKFQRTYLPMSPGELSFREHTYQ